NCSKVFKRGLAFPDSIRERVATPRPERRASSRKLTPFRSLSCRIRSMGYCSIYGTSSSSHRWRGRHDRVLGKPLIQEVYIELRPPPDFDIWNSPLTDHPVDRVNVEADIGACFRNVHQPSSSGGRSR